jgi:hypothetical protein
MTKVRLNVGVLHNGRASMPLASRAASVLPGTRYHALVQVRQPVLPLKGQTDHQCKARAHVVIVADCNHEKVHQGIHPVESTGFRIDKYHFKRDSN